MAETGSGLLLPQFCVGVACPIFWLFKVVLTNETFYF